MKKMILGLVLTLIFTNIFCQKLSDIYKKGSVKLIPDATYAANNNWNKVFETYYDTIYGAPMGNRKSLVILPDGSVIVNHRYRNFYSKFSPNGNLEKELGIQNSKGKLFRKIQSIAGILNNKILFTNADNMGNITCFDFDGNYIKTLKLDYTVRQVIPLTKDKLAVVGWSIWSDKFRDFVAIVDYNTNKQKIIWDYFTDRCSLSEHCKPFSYTYRFKNNNTISFTTMPFIEYTGMKMPPAIARVKNKLIIAIPNTGEIFVYDTNGNLITKDKFENKTNEVSIEEQKQIQENAIKRIRKTDYRNFLPETTPEERKEAKETLIREMESDMKNITKPVKIPYFSTILKDSDDNLLFFEIPKKENGNVFNVWIYGKEKGFIAKSSLICDEYDLQITPKKLVFFNEYLYGLQLKKKTEGVPLRLVRFKLTNE